MDPADSDFFKSADFADTAQILDAVPGTLPVANLAALNALNWTTAQHGTRVLQLDNGAEWYWYQPSGSGVWKRTNSVGVLTSAVQGSEVSTSLTSAPGPTFIKTPTFTAPGVRSLRVDLQVGVENTSGLNSIVMIRLFDNGNMILDWNIRCGTHINFNGTGFFNSVFINAPSAGSSHQISAAVRSAQLSSANGGSGTSTVKASTLTVSEV